MAAVRLAQGTDLQAMIVMEDFLLKQGVTDRDRGQWNKSFPQRQPTAERIE